MIRLALANFLAILGFHAYVASLPVALHGGGWSDPAIGVVMGSSAVVQIAAAFTAGSLIDRYGGRLIFLVGTGSFFLASLAFLVGIASPSAPFAVLLAVRLLQGIGMATALPSAMSLVPGLVEPGHLGFALSVAGSAANVALAIGPSVSIALLDAGSLQLVAAVTIVCVVLGGIVMWGSPRPDPRPSGHEPVRPGPLRPATATASGEDPVAGPADARTGGEGVRATQGRLRSRLAGSRAFRPAYRASWTSPLLITFLFIIHWGAVTAYLPQRAEAAGADIGLFYTIDAVAILVLRIPMGHLVDLVGPRPLLLAGGGLTAASVLLLVLPPTTPLLCLVGMGTGVGGALVIPAINVELAHRSGDSDRGSAFSLNNAAFAGGMAAGSVGGAPIVAAVGFEATVVTGAAMCLAGMGVSAVLRPAAGGPVDAETEAAIAGQ